jgi:hypothetical protein
MERKQPTLRENSGLTLVRALDAYANDMPMGTLVRAELRFDAARHALGLLRHPSKHAGLSKELNAWNLYVMASEDYFRAHATPYDVLRPIAEARLQLSKRMGINPSSKVQKRISTLRSALRG